MPRIKRPTGLDIERIESAGWSVRDYVLNQRRLRQIAEQKEEEEQEGEEEEEGEETPRVTAPPPDENEWPRLTDPELDALARYFTRGDEASLRVLGLSKWPDRSEAGALLRDEADRRRSCGGADRAELERRRYQLVLRERISAWLYGHPGGKRASLGWADPKDEIPWLKEALDRPKHPGDDAVALVMQEVEQARARRVSSEGDSERLLEVLIHGLKQRVGRRLGGRLTAEGAVYQELCELVGLNEESDVELEAFRLWANPFTRPPELVGVPAKEAIGRIAGSLARDRGVRREPSRAPLYALCKRCGMVFKRSRHDYKQQICPPPPGTKSSPCANARVPPKRDDPCWIHVERRSVYETGPPKVRVEAYCLDCYAEAKDEEEEEDEREEEERERARWGQAFFFADTDRRVHCERHGADAARAARKRRVQAVEAILERLTRWAEQRRDVRALALVGSWACGTPRGDSDVDVVLLTDSPSSYIDHDDWLASVGGVRLLKTVEWGAITERRFAVQSGLEVELGVGAPAWASVNPLDDGTRRVVSDGMRVLYDPEGVLAALAASCGAA